MKWGGGGGAQCTSFKLISDFCHVNQGVLCCEHAEQASSSGVFEGWGGWGEGATGFLNKGGGSNRLPVEFPQVRTSKHNSIKENANCFLVWTHYLLSYMYEVKKMSPIIHQLEAEEHV